MLFCVNKINKYLKKIVKKLKKTIKIIKNQLKRKKQKIIKKHPIKILYMQNQFLYILKILKKIFF